MVEGGKMRYFMAMAAVLLAAAGAFGQERKAPGQLIELDVLFAEAGPVAGEGEITAAKILDLEKQGKLTSAARIKLSLLENTPGSVQFGETVGIATGRQDFGGGRGGAMFSRQNVGTAVNATARVEDDGTIVVELTAERSGVAAAKPAADGAEAPGAEPQRMSQSTSRTTVRVASGKPIIVGGQQSAAGKEAAGIYLVLTASLPAGAKAAAAGPARPEVMIKVFALTHARATDVIKALRPILDERIIFAADERTNCIIAHGTAEQLEIAASLIQRLDES